MPFFRCDILTPYRRFFDGELESLLFVTHDGEMAILAGHEPVVAPVKACILRLKMAEGLKIAAAADGFITVSPDRVEVFLDVAEWAQEIDGKRATEALARAEKRLAEGPSSWEVGRAKAAATRARVRLEALKAAKEMREATIP